MSVRRATPDEADQWVLEVERDLKKFASKHGTAYRMTDRQLSASFEIGCFLLLTSDYERQGLRITAANLVEREFKYLTTPNGNPKNFSHLRLDLSNSHFELRQQVRIRSHIDKDICFTPDMVVVEADPDFGGEKDADYAGGKRAFFVVDSTSVVAAHECKSMTGFPELYVSFLGMVITAHSWFEEMDRGEVRSVQMGHLAPTLFVGGQASNLHKRMITAMESAFPLNIVTGIYKGGWVLTKRKAKPKRIGFRDSIPSPVAAATILADEDEDEVPF